MYRPPFDPYCQRQEAQDPNPALRTPWDGCAYWTVARALDGATGGKIAGQNEDTLRAAAGRPDKPGSDPTYLEDQVRAIRVVAPSMVIVARPTRAQLVAHLAAGGIAVLAGDENNAPASDRAYDPRFYDRVGSNGHSNFIQGTGDGKTAWWGNPEKFVGWSEPVVPIDAATHFVYAASGGRVEAILFPIYEVGPVTPPDPPTPVARRSYQIAAGDRLGLIAAKFGRSIGELAAWNGIKNVNLIRAGATIWIDPPAAAAPVVRHYVVQDHDTLSAIAPRFGTTWPKLWLANLTVIGPNPGTIRAGQVLVIP